MKLEAIEIVLLTEVTERLKREKDENLLVLVSAECFADMKKYSREAMPSYMFDGKPSMHMVEHLHYVEGIELWVTRLSSNKLLPWYCIIAMRMKGEKIKHFKGEEGSRLLIFNLK